MSTQQLPAGSAAIEPLERRSLLSAFATADGRPNTPFEFAGHVYFVANDGFRGQEMWRTDGTAAGTILLKDITPGPGSTRFTEPVSFDGSMYFFANNKLWKSDGTTDGTVRVGRGTWGTFYAGDLVVFQESIYFIGSGAEGIGLYRSNGAVSGTKRVAAFNSVSRLWAAPNGLVVLANHDYSIRRSDAFYLSDAEGNVVDAGPYLDYFHPEHTVAEFDGALFISMPLRGLWRTDGTLAGSKWVAPQYAAAMGVLGERLLLQVPSWYSWQSQGALWSSDGTPAGTVKVVELVHDTTALSGHQEMFIVSGRSVFVTSAWDEDRQVFELWSSDGTADGTVSIKLPNPPTIQWVELLAAAGNNAYFGVYRQRHTELWKTDGTAAGTKYIRNVEIGITHPGLTYDTEGFAFGDSVLFAGDDGATGWELWSSNGTEVGTSIVSDINAQPQLDVPALAAGVLHYQDGSTIYVGPHPTFTGAAPDGSTVVLFDHYGEIGRGVAAGGVYTITPTSPFELNSADVSAVVAAPNGDASAPTSPARNELGIFIDRYGPRPSSIQFTQSPAQRLRLGFDDNIQASLTAEDLVIQNLGTGQRVRPAAMALSFDYPSVASVTFPGMPGGSLPAGDYRLTIARQDVTDRVGNPLSADVTFCWTVQRIDPSPGSPVPARPAMSIGPRAFDDVFNAEAL
jgi:ELWxxDGT repeat protein